MTHQTNTASFSQSSITRWSDALLVARVLLMAAVVSFTVGSTASAWAQTDVPDTKYTFTTFYPGGVADGTHGSATGIDNAGDVVGIYFKTKVYTGYERLADGTFSLSDPGTFATEAVGVNSSGMTIVGNICIKEQCMNKTGETRLSSVRVAPARTTRAFSSRTTLSLSTSSGRLPTPSSTGSTSWCFRRILRARQE